jgi:hypothetical protein
MLLLLLVTTQCKLMRFLGGLLAPSERFHHRAYLPGKGPQYRMMTATNPAYQSTAALVEVVANELPEVDVVVAGLVVVVTEAEVVEVVPDLDVVVVAFAVVDVTDDDVEVEEVVVSSPTAVVEVTSAVVVVVGLSSPELPVPWNKR